MENEDPPTPSTSRAHLRESSSRLSNSSSLSDVFLDARATPFPSQRQDEGDFPSPDRAKTPAYYSLYEGVGGIESKDSTIEFGPDFDEPQLNTPLGKSPGTSMPAERVPRTSTPGPSFETPSKVEGGTVKIEDEGTTADKPRENTPVQGSQTRANSSPSAPSKAKPQGGSGDAISEEGTSSPASPPGPRLVSRAASTRQSKARKEAQAKQDASRKEKDAKPNAFESKILALFSALAGCFTCSALLSKAKDEPDSSRAQDAEKEEPVTKAPGPVPSPQVPTQEKTSAGQSPKGTQLTASSDANPSQEKANTVEENLPKSKESELKTKGAAETLPKKVNDTENKTPQEMESEPTGGPSPQKKASMPSVSAASGTVPTAETAATSIEEFNPRDSPTGRSQRSGSQFSEPHTPRLGSLGPSLLTSPQDEYDTENAELYKEERNLKEGDDFQRQAPLETVASASSEEVEEALHDKTLSEVSSSAPPSVSRTSRHRWHQRASGNWSRQSSPSASPLIRTDKSISDVDYSPPVSAPPDLEGSSASVQHPSLPPSPVWNAPPSPSSSATALSLREDSSPPTSVPVASTPSSTGMIRTPSTPEQSDFTTSELYPALPSDEELGEGNTSSLSEGREPSVQEPMPGLEDESVIAETPILPEVSPITSVSSTAQPGLLEPLDEMEQQLIIAGGLGLVSPPGYTGNLYKPLLPPRTAEGKKVLVLDLDETLVHSSFKVLHQANYVVPVEIDNNYLNVYVVKRPGVDEFLEAVSKHYEIVVFTASLAKYADPVLDHLDLHGVVSHRLFREACYNNRGTFVKDLSQLGRPLGHCIIIDNSPASYIFHPNNAVPISSWFNDPHDTELTDLIPFLEDLDVVDDVRCLLDGTRFS